MGKIAEADGKNIQKSEQLYDSGTDSSFLKFKDATGTTNPQNSGLGTNGTITFQSDGLRFSTQGTMSASQFAGGGMKVMTLPADSNGHIGAANLYSHFNLLAWAGALGQTGIVQILFTDINDKLVVVMVLPKVT
ncbi:hypothetical protein KF7HA_02346 [Lactococcus lactis]|nr:hypothetical protein [Lactococcus lactis]